MNDINRYRELASKWLNGSITEVEKEEFLAWYKAHVDEQITIPSSFAKDETELKQRILSNVKASMQQSYTPKTGKIRSLTRKVRAIAASIITLAVLGVGYYYLSERKGEGVHIALEDVNPGKNKAILSLDDGSVIDLQEGGQGLIVGKELYYMDGTALESVLFTNGESESSLVTLSTPRGGEYQLKLPDGTRVWLNAASSIRFPRKFNQNKREVELLAGEAFFDVAANSVDGKKVPFFVKNREQLVEVLGTQFNINTYDKKLGVVTTVAEGSVAVESNNESYRHDRMVLAVGMQTIVNESGITKYEVDPEQFLAWKEGYFYFNDANIYTVLQSFERWYDIDVNYEVVRSDDLFYGKLPKNVTLDKALNILKTAGVHFELKNGRQLIIKNK
ncbi:DUF4974 domain-containing protein [Sphingobacterium phlebotomi]|uniref:DUF4974 domain-containing protein n=1 Tax=Sphingobacterium phlebotomi TaxID=2605433 RepID=A0A5D4GV16_9SPHI|nr:FecR family protein [Sphingobacterium phlebotomi]TYR32227.1 DUF4974 domain-containing protein [Sphingobacterium phlebotomi]